LKADAIVRVGKRYQKVEEQTEISVPDEEWSTWEVGGLKRNTVGGGGEQRSWHMTSACDPLHVQ
jgi:hypothetical protein